MHQPQQNTNKHQSTLLNHIDYNNAKLIEDTLKQTEILQPLEPNDLLQNTQQYTSSQQIPQNTQQNTSQQTTQMQQNTQQYTQQNEPPHTSPQIQENFTQTNNDEPQPVLSSTASKIKGLLPSLDKYNLKYPSFLFQEINVKKLVVLVILCILFQLPVVRAVIIDNIAKLTSNEILPSIILGLLNAATYMSVITCVNLE